MELTDVAIRERWDAEGVFFQSQSALSVERRPGYDIADEISDASPALRELARSGRHSTPLWEGQHWTD